VRKMEGLAWPIEGWQLVDVGHHVQFRVPAGLKFVKQLGKGGFGSVSASFSRSDGSLLAVTKVKNAFADLVNAKRMVRDLHLMRKLQHENILGLVDLYPPEASSFEEIYFATECMQTDLHRVITSKQKLTEDHCQYAAYQLLKGLLYMHSANVVHCDLNPQKLLMNKTCDLKISDFAFARPIGDDDDNEDEDLSFKNRWYRPPESVLQLVGCHPSADIWAAGCILGEMIGRRRMFQGMDRLDQLKKIAAIRGLPSDADFDWLPPESPDRRASVALMSKLPACGKLPWSSLYPGASDAAHEALEALLTLNCRHRPDTRAALELPFFDWPRFGGSWVATCQDAGDGTVSCTALTGDAFGVFPIPLGQPVLGGWLAAEIKKTRPEAQGILRLLSPEGEIFWSEPLGEVSEPVAENPLDWTFEDGVPTKHSLQKHLCQEALTFSGCLDYQSTSMLLSTSM